MKSKKASDAVTKILSGVDIEIADVIAGSAMHCAAEQKAQGWQSEWKYDLGAFSGDQEDLEKLLGRASTQEERLLFERCIRAELSE